MILIDLQKAFDTIDHSILLQKLKTFGFSKDVLLWFESYLSNRSFCISLDNCLSSPTKLECGVPQGSILGPLLFLLYINDMPQALDKCHLFLYADDSCLLFQNKDVQEIEKVLNSEFSDLCDWFVDNKLSIHFGEDKTKSILFASKGKAKNAQKLTISYKGIEIKQHSKVKYLGCILDQSLSGESMALHVINKINGKIKFLYRQNNFLNRDLRRMLCNSLIQPHFDYASTVWYPNLKKCLQKKLQTTQNKCIRFCLQSNNRSHVGICEFKNINWLPVSDRFNMCISSHAYKFFQKKCPIYMSDIFVPSVQNRTSTRYSFQRLNQPCMKTSQGQQCLSYLGPSQWNTLPEGLKRSCSINSFKHNLKKHFFNTITRRNLSDFTC